MRASAIALLSLALACALARAQTRPTQEFITTSTRGDGFIAAGSGTRFIPWGFNYDRDFRMRLIEEYWDTEWTTVEQDLREMKELGANVVRIHLQFAKFMDGPDRPNAANLTCLRKLVELAEDLGIYLDLTGLACYRKQDVPVWFDALPESKRWNAQAHFWEAIARTCADRPGVFSYDLINEPVVPDKPLPAGEWLHPFALAGFHYVQRISLDPAGRVREDIALAWTKKMVSAIRRQDRRHMITIGMLPGKGHGFEPLRLTDALDFIAVHVYPERGELDEALRELKAFKTVKPLVIEETFPLNASAAELADFLVRSRGTADGWISFYWGRTPDELSASDNLTDKLILDWLERFGSINPNR